MLTERFIDIFVLSFLHYTNGERRLIAGEDVTTDKRYMVYLLQAQSSIRNYDSWICGGAIVNKWLILTSAACVEDVQNMYAIAGTDKYIKSHQLTENRCTQAWRRKVVYTCVPAAYDLQYNQLTKWSHDDIAVLKVEKPFLFEGRAWRECEYKPAIIPVNFDLKYEEPGTDAIVLGWGHTMEWRSPNSTVDLNQKKLQYTSVSILDQEECKKSFTNPDMGKQIDDYMICTYHDGKLDESGKLIASRKYYHYGKRNASVRRRSNNRRKGICQNDHGGPLVTWINATEHVIGIASVFRVDHQSQCIGPFLYTSTARNKEFVNCILKDLIHTDDIARRRSVCDQPEGAKSLVILRRYIKWTENTRGSLASNLNIHARPQIPISQYTGR